MWPRGIRQEFMCISLKSKVIGSKGFRRPVSEWVGGGGGEGCWKNYSWADVILRNKQGGECYTTWGMWLPGCHARRQMWGRRRHGETSEPGFTTEPGEWWNSTRRGSDRCVCVCVCMRVCDRVPVWPRACLRPWILERAAVSSSLNITTKNRDDWRRM